MNANSSEASSLRGPRIGELHAAVIALTAQVGQLVESNRELIESNRALGAELRAKSGREQQRYVSLPRAAKMLGRCEKTVRLWLKKGVVLGRKFGDTQQAPWEVDVQSIERLSWSGYAGPDAG